MASSIANRSAGALERRLSLSVSTVAAFIAVDLLLVAACLFALRQIVRLRGQLTAAVSFFAPANGTALPTLVGEDWTGVPQTIVYEQDQRPTLVYTFSKKCPYCQENWLAMHTLQALAPRWVRFAYIDTDSDKFTQQYLAENGIGQSVLLVKLSPGPAAAYAAQAVPQLLLVSHDGRVEWSHVGELAQSDIIQARGLVERQ
jgi:hypothetical protein